MSVLIEGMEMPKNCEIIIRIDEKGEVYVYDQYPTKLYKAIPVPPHGRLIDANALFEEIYKAWGFTADASDCSVLMQLINDAPTIIPADKEGT